MGKTLSAIILLFALHQILAESLDVSVYYESLCPDSEKFITTQLFPTYKAIGNEINVKLVPFGFAEVANKSGKFEFTCQHGPDECYGNKVHSCAIALYSVEESTEFVYCSMSAENPSSDEILEKCANATGISWASLQSCIESGQGDSLLEMNGEKTEEVQPKIKFIPTIIFNGEYDDDLQNDALVDLLDVVCKFLDYEPEACSLRIFDRIEVKSV